MADLWLDQLRPAKFRNVAFQVDTIEHSAGYHTVLREYPFQDLPTVFRMGQAAEEIKFSAYVIGGAYTADRDELRAALDAEGVGELVHPTVGTIKVFVLGKYSIKEAPTTEGGMARFELTFVRAETRRYPAGVPDTPQEAFRKAELAKQASADAFASAFSVADKPGWVADRAVSRITDALAATWASMKGVTAELGDFTNTAIGNYQALRDGLNNLVRTPRLLADALVTLFTLPHDLTTAAARDFATAFESIFEVAKRVTQKDFEVSIMPAVGAGLVMYGTGNADVLGLATPARAQLAALAVASDQLFESLAVSAWVQAVAAAELSSYGDALALRVTVNTQCTRLLLRASTQAASNDLPTTVVGRAVGGAATTGSTLNGEAVPPWHDAMLGLLVASLADIQGRSRDLARLTTYTPGGWMPVWLVSYTLYGTASYADEILALNPSITHPLLVQPGVALRVPLHG